MCDAIYIIKTQQTLKKRMDGHLFYLLFLLKNGHKSDSFAAHLEQHCKYTTSHKDLCKCLLFKVVKQLNRICAMIFLTKPICNTCMEERLTIIKIYVSNVSQLWTRLWRYTGPTGTKRISVNFTKHWWSCLTGESVRLCTLKFF